MDKKDVSTRRNSITLIPGLTHFFGSSWHQSPWHKIIPKCHWMIGHNYWEQKTQLCTCALSRSDGRTSEDTYDHVPLLCLHPLLV